MLVIPTGTTSRNIDPLMRMCKTVFKNSHAKIAYVMNEWVAPRRFATLWSGSRV